MRKPVVDTFKRSALIERIDQSTKRRAIRGLAYKDNLIDLMQEFCICLRHLRCGRKKLRRFRTRARDGRRSRGRRGARKGRPSAEQFLFRRIDIHLARSESTYAQNDCKRPFKS